MTTMVEPKIASQAQGEGPSRPAGLWRMALRSGRVMVGGGILLTVLVVCLATLHETLPRDGKLYYDGQNTKLVRQSPRLWPARAWFGYDALARSIFARCLLGGTISLAVGLAAAAISVLLGVSVGLMAGYRGGWVDALLMRSVDVLYGLPYILLVILFKIGFEDHLTALFGRIAPKERGWFDPGQAANLVVLFLAIGLVSWLTMARVVRGQVLSLRGQPFIEAARAAGLGEWRIFMYHLLPNLVGPITVYATLTVPSAILQESFLSFLGVGINAPLPTWGSLASEGVGQMSPLQLYWWMLTFPCALLVITLLSLNFMGDGLRDVLDPKRDQGKL
jgi:oligopeptide transport system permease protein